MAADFDGHDRARHKWMCERKLTDHARDRWDERMPEDARDAAWALLHATRDDEIVALDEFQTPDGQRPDRLWLYRGRTRSDELYGAVLLDVGGSIVTVLRIADVGHGPLRSYLLEAAAMQTGVVDEYGGEGGD